MAYTKADVENLERARIILAMGAKVVNVTIGDKTISYNQSQDKEIRDLIYEIQGQLETTQRRYVVTQTDKGL
jgi:hypothetical protein